MASHKSLAFKMHLGKQARRTRWAPFWIVLRALGKGKKVHPSRLTRVRRHWRRTKIKKKQKKEIKSGRKKKKY